MIKAGIWRHKAGRYMDVEVLYCYFGMVGFRFLNDGREFWTDEADFLKYYTQDKTGKKMIAKNKTEQTYVEHFLREIEDRELTEGMIIERFKLDKMVHYKTINFNQLSLEQADEILKQIRK